MHYGIQAAVLALDVMETSSNDAEDLVVTKGDQYDVRQQTSEREVSSTCF